MPLFFSVKYCTQDGILSQRNSALRCKARLLTLCLWGPERYVPCSPPSPLQRSSDPNSKVRNAFHLHGLECRTSAGTHISQIHRVFGYIYNGLIVVSLLLRHKPFSLRFLFIKITALIFQGM